MYRFFLVSLTVSAFFLGGCSKQEETRTDVLVSIPPYLYFVNALTDGQLKTTSLVPEGANPHLYEATPKQVKAAKESKVWIRLNESFEKKIAASLEGQNKNLLSLNLATSPEIPYLYSSNEAVHCKHCHGEDHKDLHIWLSLKLAPIQAKLIAQTLIEAFPLQKALILTNLEKLLMTFSEMDEQFTEKLAPYKESAILVSHPAFGYLCKDYGLEQISIESEGKDPLPQQLASILERAKTSSVQTALTQVQYNNKGAEIIAKKLNIPLHEVDPYSENYLESFSQIIQYITEPQ